MYEQKETKRIYKAGDSGFALIETDSDVWEQTQLPNEELKGDSFELKGAEKPKKARGKRDVLQSVQKLD